MHETESGQRATQLVVAKQSSGMLHHSGIEFLIVCGLAVVTVRDVPPTSLAVDLVLKLHADQSVITAAPVLMAVAEKHAMQVA